MANVVPVRKELGIRTVFNFLGPLINPAFPTGQIMGVSNPQILPKIAEVLLNLDCKKALVVCGETPVLDEFSICGKTIVYRIDNGKIDNFEVNPEDFGIKRAKIEDLAGDIPEKNAEIIKKIFSGKITGAPLDAVALNTAALLWAGNKASSIENGLNLSYELISNGSALNKIKELSS